MRGILNIRIGVTLLAGLVIGVGLGLIILYGLNDTKLLGGAEISINTVLSRNNLAVGMKAPDIELASLKGDTVRLSDLSGGPVLVNFWATWCAPCIAEMPTIQKYYEESGKAFKVLAVNADEPQSEVQRFVEELGLTFDVLLDPGGETQELYQLRGYPSTFILDDQGIIRALHVGILSEGQLQEYLLQVGVNQ